MRDSLFKKVLMTGTGTVGVVIALAYDTALSLAQTQGAW